MMVNPRIVVGCSKMIFFFSPCNPPAFPVIKIGSTGQRTRFRCRPKGWKILSNGGHWPDMFHVFQHLL